MYIADLYRNGLVSGLSDNGFAFVETLIDDWEDQKDDYLCDLISTVANDSVSIYYSDLYDFARENPDALEEVIEEGLFVLDNNDYSYSKHISAAMFMTIERELLEELPEIIKGIALVRLDDKHPGIDWDDDQIKPFLEDLSKEYIDTVNEIEERVNYFLSNYEGDLTVEECD